MLSDENAGELNSSGKKKELHGSFYILKDSWCRYQKTVIAEKKKYFSDIILNNRHKQGVLFSTINAVCNIPRPAFLDVSSETCEKLLHFFVDKIAIIRAHISHPFSSHPSITVTCSAVFKQF